MTRATKLGITSTIFLTLMLLCLRSDLMIVLCGFFSILFGILASTNGSKRWLAVPLLTAGLLGVFLWAGFTAS